MKKEHLNWKEAYVKSISEKNEEVNEKLSPKEMKKRLAMIKKAVEKINKQNADAAKKDALKMMKASGMFDEDVEIEEAPLVMDDMAILKTFFSEIEGRISKLKRMKQDEKAFPILQQLASMAGYGITKKGQSKGRSFRYDLKKK
jgi:altronate dehydratase